MASGVVNQWSITEPSEYITEQGLRESAARWVPANAVVMGLAGQGKTKGLVARTTIRATCNQSLCAIVPGNRLEFRYLHYWLSTNHENLRNLAGGDKRDGLNHQLVGNVVVPLPHFTLQRAIADYLDHETALIGELIERQKAFIERLRERRAAVIEEAFNCSGPRAALGHYVSALPGFAFASEGFSSDTSDVPLLRGVNIKPDGINWEQAVYWPREQLASVRRYILSEGDVVLGLDRPFVSGGTRVQRLGPHDTPSLLLQRVVKLIPRKMDPDFLTLVLQSRAFREYAEPEFTGVSVPHLSDKQVRDFRCPVPPPEQQRTIAADILNRTARIDVLISKTERHIELAKERRSALITAAVTGQIDIGAA